MAEYIPGTSVTRSAAITALRHAPAPDDSDVETRSSIMNVDYLSHEWQEEADVWASWRHTTRHKNDIANGVRLENASWRTWWKQRNNLGTVSPETLNWLKDSDVTWLYGPLHTAADPVPPMKVASTEDRLDLVKAVGKKPILKHRSISELLSIPRGSSPSLESSHLESIPEDDDRPPLYQTKSESYITKTGIRRVSPPLPDLAHAPDITLEPTSGADSPRLGSDTDSMTSGQTNKRHISFNTFVEQCIAIDHPARQPILDTRTPWRVGFGGASRSHGYDDMVDDDGVVDDDDDDGTVLTMRSSSSSAASSPASSRRPSSSSNNSRSNSHSSERATIQAIAPTVLKTQYDNDDAGESPPVVFVPPLGSPYSEDPSIATAHFGSGAVVPPRTGSVEFVDSQPQHAARHHQRASPAHSQWADGDEDRGVGFDYFNGADANASADQQQSVVRSAPVVSVPPPDRAAAATTNGGSDRASSPTTARVTSPRSPPTSPRAAKSPGKSILKPSFPDAAIAEAIRASDAQTDSYFSTNPNAIPAPASSSTNPPPINANVGREAVERAVDEKKVTESSVSVSVLPSSVQSAAVSPPMPSSPLASPPIPSVATASPTNTTNNNAPPTRGRSAVRIPGSAIGIADRERSASSKGSSPIGSVSPNSRYVPSSGSRSIGKVASRMGPPGTGNKSATSPPNVTRSSSRSTTSSASSADPKSDEKSGDADSSTTTSSSSGTVRREEGFQPTRSLPVKPPSSSSSSVSKKRLSMDIVPVLPGQPAPAQLSPGGDPPSVGASPSLSSPSPAPVDIKNSVPRPRARLQDPDSEDEGAPDGSDEYLYHSTNPTPLNSPTAHTLKLAPSSNSVSVSANSGLAHGKDAITTTTRGRVPSVSIGLDSPALHAPTPVPAVHVGERERDESEGTLVSRAVEIVSSARGLIGAFWGANSTTSGQAQTAVGGRGADGSA